VLVYYTRLSNLLALIAGIFVVIFIFRNKEGELPKWLSLLRFITTIMLFVTFLISLFVLTPAVGSFYKMMINNQLKFHHLLCPLLSIVSFIFFEKGGRLSVKDNFLATMPTLIYGIIMLILNGARVLDGPYPFLRVYNQPVWATVLWIAGIYLGTLLLGLILRLLREAVNR
jgi:uncharacterized membrane protein